VAGGQTFEPEVVVDAEVTESIKDNLIALSFRMFLSAAIAG
jgi:hypothetical protein